jgi:hypothetical protein
MDTRTLLSLIPKDLSPDLSKYVFQPEVTVKCLRTSFDETSITCKTTIKYSDTVKTSFYCCIRKNQRTRQPIDPDTKCKIICSNPNGIKATVFHVDLKTYVTFIDRINTFVDNWNDIVPFLPAK